MRHSTAVHLLRSGVDIVTIANWLGHVSIDTTNKYIAIDLEMKRKAIEKAAQPSEKSMLQASWRNSPEILTWLESL
jgi:site-specific recombinase XerD